MVYPVPAVNVAEFVVAMAPKSKSPFAVVVRFPVLGEELVAVAAAKASNEFDIATPEYSAMAKRS